MVYNWDKFQPGPSHNTKTHVPLKAVKPIFILRQKKTREKCTIISYYQG